MSQVDDEAVLAIRVRTMQIIVAALAGSVVIFLVIVLFVRPLDQPPKPLDQQVATLYFGIPYLVAILFAHFVVPGIIVSSARRRVARGNLPSYLAPPGAPPQGETQLLCGVYQVSLILGAALLEGAAFFALVAYLLEGNPWSLAAAGLLVLGLLLKIPTRSRLQNWVEGQRDRLRQEWAEG
jgi:hypothetical protein